MRVGDEKYTLCVCFDGPLYPNPPTAHGHQSFPLAATPFVPLRIGGQCMCQTAFTP